MNKPLQILTLVMLSMIATLSLAQSDQVLDRNHYVWVAQNVTAEGRVRVIITRTKPKLYLPKPQRPVIRLSVEDDDSDYYDELPDLQVGYRRPELVDQTANLYDDISDEIKIRLLLARRRALEAYTNKWA
jgi:hypothetical protein